MAMLSLLLRFCPRRNAGATSVPSAEVASSLEKCRRDNASDSGDEGDDGFVFMGFEQFLPWRAWFCTQEINAWSIHLEYFVENFTSFSEHKAGLVKIIGQSHQFLAVNNAIASMGAIRQRTAGLRRAAASPALCALDNPESSNEPDLLRLTEPQTEVKKYSKDGPFGWFKCELPEVVARTTG